MATWITRLLTQIQAGAQQEMQRRQVLMHYALLFEQQVALGEVLADTDEYCEELLDERTAAGCLKAALKVRYFEQQGLNRESALIRAALHTLKQQREQHHEQ